MANEGMQCPVVLLAILMNVLQSTPSAAQEQDEFYEPWEDNCETMNPGISTSLQGAPPPYVMSLNKQTITWDQGVYFTINALPPLTFQGFMVQARDNRSGVAVGEFDRQYPDVKVFNCFARPDNTAMHADNSSKTKVRLRWAPDTERDGSVTFYVTVAQTVEPLQNYWVSHKACSLVITNAS